MGVTKSSKYVEGEFAICPFYRKHSALEIKCEGVCGSHAIQVFTTAAEKDEWMYDFCNGTWQGCPYAAAVEEEAQ